MNETEWWYRAVSDKIRDRLTERDEGAIWSLFLDHEHIPVVCSAVDDGMREMDDVLLENLAMVLEGVGAPAVAVVVPRRTGRPLRDDLEMWRRLSARLAPSSVELVDFLVVGNDRTWVASRDGEAGAAA